MNEVNLKRQVGIFFVLSHFLVVILILIYYFLGGFLFSEMTTSISLIIPLLSVYTLTIIKFFFKERYKINLKGKKVTRYYSIITWFIPILLFLYLITIITLKAFNQVFSTFEEFKGMLALTEVVFGGYFGFIIPSMFKEKIV
ncbi:MULTISPECIES: hypothetical protein [Flavobacteriaceae]|uniref:hypothetical protein n=1 Tax=Flavobacteriaceae TaxID=49546 RepID=UPI001491429D|nr:MULTISPECIES: hypothetical protein [Allomuricauda]MDC6364644.1 hypothetical protein [Muricauda sp. AC10]